MVSKVTMKLITWKTGVLSKENWDNLVCVHLTTNCSLMYCTDLFFSIQPPWNRTQKSGVTLRSNDIISELFARLFQQLPAVVLLSVLYANLQKPGHVQPRARLLRHVQFLEGLEDLVNLLRNKMSLVLIINLLIYFHVLNHKFKLYAYPILNLNWIKWDKY